MDPRKLQLESLTGTENHSWNFKNLLTTPNILQNRTSRLLAVRYAVHLYQYHTVWRKNPQWSFSCCLALILPIISLPEEISGVVGTNVIDNQLQSGHVDMPTILGAVQDSGAVDISLEEGKQEKVNTEEMQKDKGQDAKCNNKLHQGAQTELLTLFPVTDGVAHEQVEDT